MNNQIQLPSHIANAPTPITESACADKGYEESILLLKATCANLEREQGYMMEVLELFELATHCNCKFGNECHSCKALTAYNNLKAYMEQKKGEVKV